MEEYASDASDKHESPFFIFVIFFPLDFHELRHNVMSTSLITEVK